MLCVVFSIIFGAAEEKFSNNDMNVSELGKCEQKFVCVVVTSRAETQDRREEERSKRTDSLSRVEDRCGF